MSVCNHRHRRGGFTCALIAALALAAGCERRETGDGPQVAPHVSTAPAVRQGSRDAPDLFSAITQVARQNIPVVVHIDITSKQEVQNPLSQFGDDPFFRRFFGAPDMPRNFQREVRALGSGMIMDRQGHILTNAHVVSTASTIQVTLADGERYEGKVVGIDPRTDLAVVKINPGKDLPHVVFGDSDQAEVGEWVVAIGHPRGLDQTVTQGIISAKHRTNISDPEDYQDFLQTDAAINPGNSGGPLFNLRGQVIGVNNMIASQSGGFEGIGFAIPSNLAVHVARQLIEKGKVERGWLGVSIQDVTPELAKSLNLNTTEGALVNDVVQEGPAAKAGLQRGDLVVAVDGRSIRDASQLRNHIANIASGTNARITVLRQGQRRELTVKIGSLETGAKRQAQAAQDRLGAQVRPLAADQAKRYNLPGGVVLAEVDPDGPLGGQGFEPGDVILQINNAPITSVEAYAAAVQALPAGQKAAILVVDHRTGSAGYVAVTPR